VLRRIKSKLFFSKVLDSLDLSVSYYSVGKVLKDEMYKRSSFYVKTGKINSTHLDIPIFFDFKGGNNWLFGKEVACSNALLEQEFQSIIQSSFV